MKTKRKMLTVVMMMAAIGLAAGAASAAAIGIDVGDGAWDDQGEDNANGLQITATSFGKIGTGGGEKTVTVDGITFTHNIGGAETVAAWADYSCILDNNTGRYSGAIPWKLEGLSAGTEWNLAFLSGPSSQPGKFTVNGVGTATSDADGDGNFENVVASGLGVIEGTWDVWAPNQWATLTGLLVESVPGPTGPPPPTPAAPVTSIDFDRTNGNDVQSGEPTHAEGMTLPGQVGPWYKLEKSGTSPSITTPEGTFTFDTTGSGYRTYNTGSNILREDFFWLTDGYGPITWELTDLTPNGTYDIICYGRYDPAYGGYRGADMSIAGYNGGSPVPQETSFPSEGDWNFDDVTADATGKITGTFAWNGNAHAEFAAIQFQEVPSEPIPEPATMCALGLAVCGLGGYVRRRRRA